MRSLFKTKTIQNTHYFGPKDLKPKAGHQISLDEA